LKNYTVSSNEEQTNILMNELQLNNYISFYKNTVNIKISRFSLIYNLIIPFFDDYKLIGHKANDFLLFKEAAFIMAKKSFK
jgi:LAGLIDADG endonuclease